uniref:Valine--tRNA ligase n=1 Tax=Amphimedon queenslandica TaxID=400682 RepID=A0A1X7UQH7_AMPQE
MIANFAPVIPPVYSSLLQLAAKGRTLARSYQSGVKLYSTMAENNGPGAPPGGEPALELTEKQLKKAAKKDAKKAKFDKKIEAQKKGQQQATPPGDKSDKIKKTKDVLRYEILIPKGDKKDVSGPMPSGYSPNYVEAVWYDWWEKEGFFKPEYGGRKVTDPCPEGKFIICLPPPNVTGNLHLGHALTNAIEDAITRWHRMNGKMVLWNPGTDHAGIATQVVVEKKLKREQGKSRYDLGREGFIEEVWKWKNEKGDNIYNQVKRMGCSVDWDRAFFTMDNQLSRAVKECFVLLHDEGTIYRSNRLVNWSCTLKSAISDIEVDKHELSGRTFLSVPNYDNKIEFGVLVSFAYKVEGSDAEIVVATTRVETMLGDTAIAVHPQDQRYKDLVGRLCLHPFCDRKLPIIADEMVDMSFGTGAVKITPAHDHNDYECGKRHNLPFIEMINDEGYITDVAQEFKGMKRFDARKSVLAALKGRGLYRETKDHPMTVPICSRSKDIVEPLIKPQWWLNCTEMAQNAVQAVKDGSLKLIPNIHDKTWFNWLDNSRDWCISRQLWWGHRIPAYFVTFNDPSLPEGNESDGQYWVSGRSQDEALQKAAEKFKVPKEQIVLKQDEDVLDTWFSSGLLPFSIFGWPDKTDDLSSFYPNSLLETGHDILFFWVARMVFFGQKLMGRVPFPEVYLHAMVRDAHGRKMSKSLGNVIDPLDVMRGISLEGLHERLLTGNLDPKEVERAKAGQKADYPNGIPECGADAMRFALCAYTAQGRDINLDVKRVVGYRHFCNKIWNALKFSLNIFGTDFTPNATSEFTGFSTDVMERWILSRLSSAVDDCDNGFTGYNFPDVTTAIYNFWLYELCDVYLEYLKPIVYGSDEGRKLMCRNVLYTCLETGLRLLSPFMPFLTEELWQRLPRRPGETAVSICVNSYPKKGGVREEAIEEEMKLVQETVTAIRRLKQDYLPPKARPEVSLIMKDESAGKILNSYLETMITLSQINSLVLLAPDTPPPRGCAFTTIGNQCLVYMQLKGLVDAQKEINRLEETLAKKSGQRDKFVKTTEVDGYTEKVSIEFRNANQEKIDGLTAEIADLTRALEGFRAFQKETES